MLGPRLCACTLNRAIQVSVGSQLRGIRTSIASMDAKETWTPDAKKTSSSGHKVSQRNERGGKRISSGQGGKLVGQGRRNKTMGAEEDAVSEVAPSVAGEVAKAKGRLRASKVGVNITKEGFDLAVVHDLGEREDLRDKAVMVRVAQRSG